MIITKSLNIKLNFAKRLAHIMLRRVITICTILSAYILFILMQNYEPKNKCNVAVGIIEKNGKVLIAKRVGKDNWGPKWSFLGGKVDGCETLHECLQRELQEELNIEAEIGDYFGTNHFYLNGKLYELHAFKVNHFTGQIKLNDEHTDFAWVAPHELDNYEIIAGSLPFVKQLQSCNFSYK